MPAGAGSKTGPRRSSPANPKKGLRMAYRNFVFDSEIADDVRREAAKQVATRLTRRWNEINNALERKHFTQLDMRDEGLDWIAEQADDEEEADRLRNQHRVEVEAALLEMQAIEGQLSMLGARIMRPYEHWNEEERVMQYLENRDFYGE